MRTTAVSVVPGSTELASGYPHAHAVRLGLQGVELLTTGRITLPVPEPDRAWVDAWLHRSYLDFWSRTGQLGGLGSEPGQPGSAVSRGGTRRASGASAGPRRP